MHIALQESDIAVIRINIEATNQHKAPIFSVSGYIVLDLLGSGSFGSVYKVATCLYWNRVGRGHIQFIK